MKIRLPQRLLQRPPLCTASIAIAALGIGMATGASASVILYEPYPLGTTPTGYTPESSLSQAANANVQATEGSWNGAIDAPSGTIFVVSGTGLSYSGLPTTGGSIESTASGTNRRAFSETNLASAVYYSFLIRFDDFDSAAVLLGLTDTANNNVSGVRVEKVSTTSALLKVHSNTSYSSTSYEVGVGTTYLIVGKWSPGEVSDTTQLWINPVAGEEEPGSTLTLTAGKGAGVAKWSAYIHSLGGTTDFAFDEFRVGTTWESVTQIPEPQTALLLAGPLLMLMKWRFGKRRD